MMGADGAGSVAGGTEATHGASSEQGTQAGAGSSAVSEASEQAGARIEWPGPEDAAALGALFHEDMLQLGEPTELEAQQELARRIIAEARAEPRRCLCWVARAEAGHEPGGVLLANFNWSPKFAGRSLWIETLYVSPALRRQGLGRRLVDELLDWAEAHQIPGVDIEAYRGNTPASVLYRTMGFRRLGRERFAFRVTP